MSHTTPCWECRSAGGRVDVFAADREAARTIGAAMLGRSERVVTVRYISNKPVPTGNEIGSGSGKRFLVSGEEVPG